MGTKPVRVPEDQYNRLRKTAAELDVSLSEAIEIVLESGYENLHLDDYLSLDPDLQAELREVYTDPELSTDTEILAEMDEVYQRQRERNRGRSELEPEPQ
jgi:hypothetical protein